MKRIDFLKASDFEQLYEAFSRAQVRKDNCSGRQSGFYEYPLSPEEVRKRVELSSQERLGLVVREGEKIQAYLLAYRASQAREMNDEVLRRVSVQENAVYADQLFMENGLPVYVAGRLVTAWDSVVMSRYKQGIFSAVPWKPWRNVAGARFNFARGCNVSGFLKETECDLAIFTRPFCEVGKVIPKFEIDIRN